MSSLNTFLYLTNCQTYEYLLLIKNWTWTLSPIWSESASGVSDFECWGRYGKIVSNLIRSFHCRYSSADDWPRERGVAPYINRILQIFISIGDESVERDIKRFFRVWIDLSTRPFVARCPGAMNCWKTPLFLQYDWKTLLLKIVALSGTSSSGYLWLETISSRSWIVLKLESGFLVTFTSAHFDFASTYISKSTFSKEPVA